MQITIRRFHYDTVEKSTITAANTWEAAEQAFRGYALSPGDGTVIRAIDATGTIIGTAAYN